MAGNIDERLARAGRRRQALQAFGLSTYEIARAYMESSIICLCCGMTSPNHNDVVNLYCGFCHEFHTQETFNERRVGRSSTAKGGGATS